VTHRHCKSGHPKRKISACGICARPESARNDRNCQRTEDELDRFSYPFGKAIAAAL